MFAYTLLQSAAGLTVILLYGVGWILPCVLTVIFGIKKNRGALGGILCAISFLSGLLWGILGLVLGWLSLIIICSFKKNDAKKA